MNHESPAPPPERSVMRKLRDRLLTAIVFFVLGWIAATNWNDGLKFVTAEEFDARVERAEQRLSTTASWDGAQIIETDRYRVQSFGSTIHPRTMLGGSPRIVWYVHEKSDIQPVSN